MWLSEDVMLELRLSSVLTDLEAGKIESEDLEIELQELDRLIQQAQLNATLRDTSA